MTGKETADCIGKFVTTLANAHEEEVLLVNAKGIQKMV